MNEKLNALAAEQATQAVARKAAAEVLAKNLMEGALQGRDALEDLAVLHLAIPTLLWMDTCELMEVCPTHLQDEMICRDDALSCREV